MIDENDIIGDGTNRGLCCVPDYYDDNATPYPDQPLMEAIEIVCILKGRMSDRKAIGVDNETGYRHFLELAKQISVANLAEDNGLDEGYIDEVFEGKRIIRSCQKNRH